MDASTLFVLSHLMTALMTISAFLIAAHFALRRRLLLAIVCLACFLVMIQPSVVLNGPIFTRHAGLLFLMNL